MFLVIPPSIQSHQAAARFESKLRAGIQEGKPLIGVALQGQFELRIGIRVQHGCIRSSRGAMAATASFSPRILQERASRQSTAAPSRRGDGVQARIVRGVRRAVGGAGQRSVVLRRVKLRPGSQQVRAGHRSGCHDPRRPCGATFAAEPRAQLAAALRVAPRPMACTTR